MTPVEEITKSNNPRSSAFNTSGHASPNGFPFFASTSSNSPRGTPTPTGQYDSASDAFNFPRQSPAMSSYPNHQLRHSVSSSASGSGTESDYTTLRNGGDNESVSSSMSYSHSNATPKATPLLGNTPPGALGGLEAAYGEGSPWARPLGQHQQPQASLAGH